MWVLRPGVLTPDSEYALQSWAGPTPEEIRAINGLHRSLYFSKESSFLIHPQQKEASSVGSGGWGTPGCESHRNREKRAGVSRGWRDSGLGAGPSPFFKFCPTFRVLGSQLLYAPPPRGRDRKTERMNQQCSGPTKEESWSLSGVHQNSSESSGK